MDDLISRQAVKAKKVYSNERHEYVVPVADIDWLPSVTLAREFCEDAISRQAALNVIEREMYKGDALQGVEDLPSYASVRELYDRTGRCSAGYSDTHIDKEEKTMKILNEKIPTPTTTDMDEKKMAYKVTLSSVQHWRLQRRFRNRP